MISDPGFGYPKLALTAGVLATGRPFLIGSSLLEVSKFGNTKDLQSVLMKRSLKVQKVKAYMQMNLQFLVILWSPVPIVSKKKNERGRTKLKHLEKKKKDT